MAKLHIRNLTNIFPCLIFSRSLAFSNGFFSLRCADAKEKGCDFFSHFHRFNKDSRHFPHQISNEFWSSGLILPPLCEGPDREAPTTTAKAGDSSSVYRVLQQTSLPPHKCASSLLDPGPVVCGRKFMTHNPVLGFLIPHLWFQSSVRRPWFGISHPPDPQS